ncbi:S66 family peptidase [Mycoplasma zalophi]|uniref:LD-carboxypeptidase n=1 Tax=Mycoplasma zalophi TaxID=191287 RepID=A0ABS6DP22_9MOLU|nr:S66 peptidase family protein [Mycoplasma zalophi]MBU4691169.1 LD-carboxypeptidase [Mycoplasma zalophi]MBU4692059.1 LD-carboxypeptidase [Mycoplasma zalophi]
MNKFMFLKPGDEIRVIAPARSLKLIGEINTDLAIKKLESMGFKVTFGKNVYEVENRLSGSIEKKVEDLHEAFLDKNVKAILTVIGGFNSHQLLPYINWEIIKNNPKIFCGFSDITSLHLAILKHAKFPVFYGPHFSSFAMLKNSEYIEKQFRNMFLSEDKEVQLESSELWSDDLWFIDQENRKLEKNTGWWNIQDGKAKGKILGGNLSTLLLINPTSNFPDVKEDTILAIETVSLYDYDNFERMLVSLIQSPWFKHVKGLMIGRFCLGSNISKEDLVTMLTTKPELKNIPIIANLDFGHSMPLSVIPLGLEAELKINNESEIKIFK